MVNGTQFGTVLAKGGGTCNMHNHLQHKHKDSYVQKLASKDTSSSQLKIQVDDKGTVELWHCLKLGCRKEAYSIPTSCILVSYIQATSFLCMRQSIP